MDNKKKRFLKDYGELQSKRIKFIYDDDDDEFPSTPEYDNEPYNSDDDKELVIINTTPINNLIDLIELGILYDTTKKYNIDMKVLNKLVDPLTELNNMIGMETVKQDMIDHILFRIQKLDNENKDMMHTVISGPPGVGKTEVARIIGKIYLAMGILKNDKFIKATRSNLIAGYLGQTAKATQTIIDSAIGGILFIDEVYSLGNAEKRDSFAKECIDTINENLTEKKTEFICIIAGYKEEIDKCFFAFNSGLERRFPIKFTIEEYNFEELFLIFKKKITDCNWMLDEKVTSQFFKKKMDSFKYFGGDMEVLFNRCKRAHSRRIFCTEETKKVINLDDLRKGFEIFKKHQKKKDLEFMKSMFI
jgi:SpoVK/Ycf46/Vps4 family AAA+-type ATPase